ncbi:GDSL-type esterase/lipase family protein [Proteus mirabilis]|uniref:Uncharacterized protein n=1 Tax=Proteus mirabilis TaxID=584 RepID=A0A7D5W388_PROMI|nr:GDSL-type esterase/lipase family protein [Proteus mirabilis]EIM6939844.1 hypothetical protein [Proteus mirabilis]EIO2231390.1 hypothetical protein [Proteus mirabilis]EKU5731778.1 hypothetical protein [Proteus mirabilis]EKV4067242.1 hypothetical protein [Proteus mirabilis]EKW6533632.1 hypothetical protein [Proteus mirabilis]
MSTIPTQNPVPSEAPRDLKYNSGKVDEFVTSNNHFYTDRFGKKHYTIDGINFLSKQAMLNYGYITKRSFESGNTIINPNDVLLWEDNGEYYRWDGELPKVVSAGSTPESAGGIGAGGWVSIGDAALRGEISQSTKNYNTFIDAVNSNTDSIIKSIFIAGRISPNDGGCGLYTKTGTGTPGDTDDGSFFVTQNGVRFDLVSDATIATFGGVDGGSFRSALDRLKTYVSNRDRVLKIKSNHEILMNFSPEIPSGYFNGFTLDVDENVTIATASDEAVKSPLVNLVRPVKFFFTGNNTSYLLRPTVGITNGEYKPLISGTPPKPPQITNANYTDNKSLFINIPEKENYVYTSFLNDWEFLSSSWPMGVFDTVSPASILEDSLSIPAPTEKFVCASFSKIKPSAEYFVSMYAGDNTNGISAITVEAEDKRWIYYENHFGEGYFIEGTVGGSFKEKKVSYLGGSTHGSQWIKNSITSVRIDTLKSFTILVNGIERIAVRETEGIIGRIGFGSYGADNNYMSLFYPYIIENRQYRSAKPINIAIVGDSITDASIGNGWAQFAQQALEGTHGIRVGRMETIAISGYASNDIIGVFNATNLSDIDVVLFQIGVNDIQRQSGRELLRDNVRQMMVKANDLGIPCIVSLPTQFYTRDQSVTLTGVQGYGQPSANYEKGAIYRAILANDVTRLNFEIGQPLNAINTGSLDDMGPVVAEYLMTNQDPMVMDNIHPTSYGRMLLGLSNARAIASHMFGKRTDPVINNQMPESWGKNSWSVNLATSASVTSYPDGKIALSGVISNTGSGITENGTIVCHLPLSISPTKRMVFAVAKVDEKGNPIGQGNIVIDNNGEIKIYGFSTGNICLDGVIY